MEINVFRPRHGMLNVESTVAALSYKAASIRFKQAAERLLNVTKWHTLPCSLLSALRLTDEAGNIIDRQVRENDYFVFTSFDSSVEGWVKVEKLQFETNQTDSIESVVMRARASKSPIEDLDVNAINSDSPSSTFRVYRKGLNVTVAMHGDDQDREVSEALYDFVSRESRPSPSRAIPGVARVQWRSLVNGILSTWK